jgi:hypothetical protein
LTRCENPSPFWENPIAHAKPDRPQKINFAEMRESGVRWLLVYCADYRYSPRGKVKMQLVSRGYDAGPVRVLLSQSGRGSPRRVIW